MQLKARRFNSLARGDPLPLFRLYRIRLYCSYSTAIIFYTGSERP
jgi:hypothetical protein